MRKRLVNGLLLCTSLLISLALCEGILRILSENQYFIWPPHLKQYFLPKESIFPGIQGKSFFKINALGFRGDEKRESSDLYVVTLGGSTTECLYLDQEEEWPALLETYLNQETGKNIQVFNGGRSGLNSYHHKLQVPKILEIYPWIDWIIVMQGINDLQYALSFEDEYQPEDPQILYQKAFLITPLSYKRSYLNVYLSKLKKELFSSKLAQDPYGDLYVKWRENRAKAHTIVDSAPDLKKSLAEYKKNTEAIIQSVESKNKKILFLTQPVMWTDAMPEELKQLCWFGWIGKDQNENNGNYYSFKQLKASMDKYNTLLKKICSERGVDWIDLEGVLEKDTTTFYDDCHFNERGAEKVARRIADYFKKNMNQDN